MSSGTVEVDESYIGSTEVGTRGREVEDKTIVAVATEKRGRGLGRIRLQQVADVSANSLIGFVQSTVASGSEVHTNGWSGYARLTDVGYHHRITVISAGSEPAHVVMPRVHLVASLLKRWLTGTHQGGIQRRHLNYYLDGNRSDPPVWNGVIRLCRCAEFT